MIYLTLYIIGIIGTYIICKVARNIMDENNWNAIIVALLISIFWPLSYFIFIILSVIKVSKSKPPKWL